MTRLEPFSEGYYLVDADVVEYTGHKVAVGDELMTEFRQKARVPFLKFENEHYLTGSEWGIPSGTVAVPGYVDAERNDPVLLAKNKQAKRLLETEEWRDGSVSPGQ